MRICLTLDITRDKDREYHVDEVEVNDSGRMGFAPTVSPGWELEYEEEDEDDSTCVS